MAVTEGHIDVGTTSVQLDTALVTQSSDAGSRDVHREAVVITDPAVNAARARVRSIPPIRKLVSDQTYAASVTDQRAEFIQDTLTAILGELKTMNAHLVMASDEEISKGDAL